MDWGKTKTDGWEEEGTHKIKIVKPGYKTIEDVVKIEKRKSQKYEKNLAKDN